MNIILIHGQGRTPLSLAWLGWWLRQQGHQPHYFGYVSFWESFAAIKQRFVRRLQADMGADPYAIVAHSLGGLIVRASLPHIEANLPRHVVMLAPPNQPARAAKIARLNPLYVWFTGDCGRKLADDSFYETLPCPPIPTTIIAGTQGPRGRFSPFGQQLNDWVLTVEETELGEGYEVIVAEASHAFIMNHRDVARIIGELL
jgi:hypothetical protein